MYVWFDTVYVRTGVLGVLEVAGSHMANRAVHVPTWQPEHMCLLAKFKKRKKKNNKGPINAVWSGLPLPFFFFNSKDRLFIMPHYSSSLLDSNQNFSKDPVSVCHCITSGHYLRVAITILVAGKSKGITKWQKVEGAWVWMQVAISASSVSSLRLIYPPLFDSRDSTLTT